MGEVTKVKRMLEILKVKKLAVQFGRALSLTIVAANANPATEDEAIAAMDGAWERVVDRLYDFLLGEDG